MSMVDIPLTVQSILALYNVVENSFVREEIEMDERLVIQISDTTVKVLKVSENSPVLIGWFSR